MHQMQRLWDFGMSHLQGKTKYGQLYLEVNGSFSRRRPRSCMHLTVKLSCMQGQGIVQPDKIKKAADPVRQAANKVSSMFGGSDSSSYNSHMLRSNRQVSAQCSSFHLRALPAEASLFQCSVATSCSCFALNCPAITYSFAACILRVQKKRDLLGLQMPEVSWFRNMHMFCLSRIWVPWR